MVQIKTLMTKDPRGSSIHPLEILVFKVPFFKLDSINLF